MNLFISNLFSTLINIANFILHLFSNVLKKETSKVFSSYNNSSNNEMHKIFDGNSTTNNDFLNISNLKQVISLISYNSNNTNLVNERIEHNYCLNSIIPDACKL